MTIDSLNENIYIFTFIAVDEAVILLQFICQWKILWHHLILVGEKAELPLTPSINVLCLIAFVWRQSHIAMTLSAGVPPSECSKPSGKQY